MIKMNSMAVIVGSALLTLITVGLGLYCYPWGINDPQSSAGFFTLAIYFFIQTMSYAMTIKFGGEEMGSSLIGESFRGFNKLLAAAMILINAVPHPQFTGVLLWLGVGLVLLYSGAKNVWNVGSALWEDVRDYRQSRADVRKRIQVEIEITKAMKAEEARIAQESEVEKDLLSDLAGFLGDTDSSGPRTRGDVG